MTVKSGADDSFAMTSSIMTLNFSFFFRQLSPAKRPEPVEPIRIQLENHVTTTTEHQKEEKTILTANAENEQHQQINDTSMVVVEHAKPKKKKRRKKK